MRSFMLAVLALTLAVPALAGEEKDKPEPEAVTIETEDGWNLAATFTLVEVEDAEKKLPAVILVHMLNQKKEDWESFTPEMTKAGYAVLAFDMRGHGASVRADGKARPWRKFKRKDWQAAEKDILAARDWFLENNKQIDPDRIALVGASIGANLCLRALASDEKLRGAVLLSPGLDYHGVTTEDALEKVRPEQQVAAFACANDIRSATCVQMLKRMLQAFERKRRESFTAKVYSGRTITAATGGLHGTRMLGRVKGIEKDILDFLESALAPPSEEKKEKKEKKPSLERTLDALQRAL